MQRIGAVPFASSLLLALLIGPDAGFGPLLSEVRRQRHRLTELL